MASYYSDHFNGVNAVTLATDNSVLDNSKILATGVGHGRVHYKRAEQYAGMFANDTLRMMQFKSGDRLNQLYLTSSATGSAGTIHVGLHKTGRSHDGDLIEVDVLTAGVTLAAARNHVEYLGGGVPDADLFRGKALWEIVQTGYTEDPMEDWDVVVTCSVTFSSLSSTIILEAFYTSGD